MGRAGRWIMTVLCVVSFGAVLPEVGVAIGPKMKKEASAPQEPAADPEARARQQALDNGWPDTPAGIMASSWVEALSAGQDAMKVFLETNLAEGALQKRSMEDRLVAAAKLHEQVGDLILSSVAESKTAHLTADLLSEAGETHRFVFELTAEEPHKLVRIAMVHPGAHGGHGGHSRSR